MPVSHHPTQPMITASLRSFFHHSLQRATRNQGVPVSDEAHWYLANLLTQFARSEQLFAFAEGRSGLRPLAFLYADAQEATSRGQRRLILQHLGDVALFVTGLFSASLSQRPVGAGYYIAMGGAAYAFLGEDYDDQPPGGVFRELSRCFARFVDVLAEVGERSEPVRRQNMLETFSAWAEQSTPDLERRLRQLGIRTDPGQRPC